MNPNAIKIRSAAVAILAFSPLLGGCDVLTWYKAPPGPAFSSLNSLPPIKRGYGRVIFYRTHDNRGFQMARILIKDGNDFAANLYDASTLPVDFLAGSHKFDMDVPKALAFSG
ncbi:MAG: hypothetical protein WDN04_06760 [Rhodospirillales bacterium]